MGFVQNNVKSPHPRDLDVFSDPSKVLSISTGRRYAAREMAPSKSDRILRQHVETDSLFGVDAVPIHRAADDGTDRRQSLDTETKVRLLKDLDEQEVRGCTNCGLCQSRTQTVFGEGDVDAKILFVGEGPGQSEDEQGRPFVGRAGSLLDKMITAMGLRRNQVYIANIVKCRPPENRTPTLEEITTCWAYLRRQIQIIQPKVIVTLGSPATRSLLDTREGITRIRGTWHQYDDMVYDVGPIPVMPTFHPAYLLRSHTLENRGKVWSDLQAVMEMLKK